LEARIVQGDTKTPLNIIASFFCAYVLWWMNAGRLRACRYLVHGLPTWYSFAALNLEVIGGGFLKLVQGIAVMQTKNNTTDPSVINLAEINGNQVIIHAKDNDYNLSVSQTYQLANQLQNIAEAADLAVNLHEIPVPFSEEEIDFLYQRKAIYEQQHQITFADLGDFVSHIVAQQLRTEFESLIKQATPSENQVALPKPDLKLDVAGALGGSVVIYSDIESYHLSATDAVTLSHKIERMANTVVTEVSHV